MSSRHGEAGKLLAEPMLSSPGTIGRLPDLSHVLLAFQCFALILSHGMRGAECKFLFVAVREGAFFCFACPTFACA